MRAFPRAAPLRVAQASALLWIKSFSPHSARKHKSSLPGAFEATYLCGEKDLAFVGCHPANPAGQVAPLSRASCALLLDGTFGASRSARGSFQVLFAADGPQYKKPRFRGFLGEH